MMTPGSRARGEDNTSTATGAGPRAAGAPHGYNRSEVDRRVPARERTSSVCADDGSLRDLSEGNGDSYLTPSWTTRLCRDAGEPLVYRRAGPVGYM